MTADEPARRINDGSLDAPFDSQAPTPMLDHDQVIYAAGIVVIAAVVPDDHGTKKPALIFRFTEATTGAFLRPLALILEPDQAAALPELVTAAVEASIRAAAK